MVCGICRAAVIACSDVGDSVVGVCCVGVGVVVCGVGYVCGCGVDVVVVCNGG